MHKEYKMSLEIPQYIQKLNPSAALLSDRVPNVELTGIRELGDSLNGFIKGIQDYRDELNLDKAKKEYEVWLINEKKNFAMNTTIDNLETESANFNQTATNKIDEVLRANGIPWHKMQKASNRMQLQYIPQNLQYSIQVANDVKNRTYLDNETNYENNLGNLMSSVSVAQLRGANGVALLDQCLNEADSSVDQAITAGFLPASMREIATTKKKMQVTSYFFGRLLKEDPQAAYDFVTHNSKTVLIDQAKLFKEKANTNTYQALYSKSQKDFADYQKELSTLSAYEKQKLNIGNVYVGEELSTGSYMYNMGAIYQEAKTHGMSLKEAINEPGILMKYATPYSPVFTNASVYYNKDTKDFAGMYRGNSYIPANLTPGTKYFNASMKYLNMQTIVAVQDAYASYDTTARKEAKQKDNLNYAQKLWEINKQLESENMTGDVPTNVVYPSGNSNNTQFKGDPYQNVPQPRVNMSKQDIQTIITQEAKDLGVPLAAAFALFDRESGFNPSARGGSGEYGLGQLMPGTAQALGVKNPWNVLENVRASLRYYKGALNAAGGDPLAAYAGYNGGYGSIKYYKAGKGTAQLRNNVAGFGKYYTKYKGQYGAN